MTSELKLSAEYRKLGKELVEALDTATKICAKMVVVSIRAGAYDAGEGLVLFSAILADAAMKMRVGIEVDEAEDAEQTVH